NPSRIGNLNSEDSGARRINVQFFLFCFRRKSTSCGRHLFGFMIVRFARRSFIGDIFVGRQLIWVERFLNREQRWWKKACKVFCSCCEVTNLTPRVVASPSNGFQQPADREYTVISRG